MILWKITSSETKSSQWIRTKTETKVSNVIDESNVKTCLIHFHDCVLTGFWSCNLLNKYQAVIEKAAGNEEFIACIRRDLPSFLRS